MTDPYAAPPAGAPVPVPTSWVAGPPAGDGRPRLRWWEHGWRMLVAWLAGAVLFLVVFGFSPAGREEPGYPALVDVVLLVDLLAGQVAVLLLLLRRRFPVLTAVLVMAVTVVSAFSVGAALVASFSLATRRRWRPLVAVGAINLVAASTYESLFAPVLETGGFAAGGRSVLLGVAINAVFSVLIYLVVVLVGWNVGARRELVESWRLQAETAHREQAARVSQAQLAERSRIAREMHDVLAHRLSVVAMHAGALTYRDDLPREEVATTAETIRSNARTALEELREVLGVLREGEEPADAPQPELADVPGLVASAESRGERVRLEVPGTLWPAAASLPAATGRHAYRVVQEALTNARKHAPDGPVVVHLDGAPGRGLVVQVRNGIPGGGERRPAGGGFGLTGMAERVELAGGRLDVGRRGADFVVDVWLPWPTGEEAA